MHDGVTVGGHPVATRANADGTISLIKKDGTSAGTINADGLFNDTLTSTNTNQALTAAQGKVLKDSIGSSTFGVGQSTKPVTRIVNTEYTNPTNKTIVAYFTIKVSNYGTSTGYCDGEEVGRIYCDVGSGGSVVGQITITVPSNSKYKIIGGQILKSSELS